MNVRHKVLREMIKNMPVRKAEEMLLPVLPEREFKAIYLADVQQKSLFDVADELGTTDSNVKKIRRSGYAKLATSFYAEK